MPRFKSVYYMTWHVIDTVHDRLVGILWDGSGTPEEYGNQNEANMVALDLNKADAHMAAYMANPANTKD